MLFFTSLAENKGARAHAMKDAIVDAFNRVISKRIPASSAPYVIDFVVLDKQKPNAGAAAKKPADAKDAKSAAAKASLTPEDSPFEVIVGELNPFHDYTGQGVGSGSEVKTSNFAFHELCRPRAVSVDVRLDP
jgi:hypothetical protein